jgi:prepilin-type processing-associated H-X9-DG protein
MEQQGLYDLYEGSRMISGPENDPLNQRNIRLRASRLPFMLCPSDAFNNVAFTSSDSNEGGNWARGNYGANASLAMMATSQVLGNERWASQYHRGIMGLNISIGMSQIADGASNTILLGELRAGIAAIDRRGVWALGGPASSSLWAQGSDDCLGPNCALDASDNLMDGNFLRTTLGVDTLVGEAMGCQGVGASQGGARSMHSGGVNVCMADGSVTFINDYIETSSSYWESATDMGYWKAHPNEFKVWQRLNASADSLPIDSLAY